MSIPLRSVVLASKESHQARRFYPRHAQLQRGGARSAALRKASDARPAEPNTVPGVHNDHACKDLCLQCFSPAKTELTQLAPIRPCAASVSKATERGPEVQSDQRDDSRNHPHQP